MQLDKKAARRKNDRIWHGDNLPIGSAVISPVSFPVPSKISPNVGKIKSFDHRIPTPAIIEWACAKGSAKTLSFQNIELLGVGFTVFARYC
jgi:hypothetical protein